MKIKVKQLTTSAINNALAQVMLAGGGTVKLSSGIYAVDSPWDSATNSILTLPQVMKYEGIPPTVRLIGQARGAMLGPNCDQYAGGVVIDASNVTGASGTLPSVFSAAPYIVNTTSIVPGSWNQVNIIVDKILFLLPASSPFSCLNFANAMQASIGDDVTIMCKIDPATGFCGQPQGSGTFGILMPQAQNNVINNVGSCRIHGFSAGLYCADSCVLKRPFLSENIRGLFLMDAWHAITGSVGIAACQRLIEVQAGSTTVVDLQLQSELYPGGPWWGWQYGIYDVSNTLKGKIEYDCLELNVGYVNLPVAGAGNLQLKRLI